MSQSTQVSASQAHRLYLDQCRYAADLAATCFQSGGETDDGTEYLAHTLEVTSMLCYACLDGGGEALAAFWPRFLATVREFSGGECVAPSIRPMV